MCVLMCVFVFCGFLAGLWLFHSSTDMHLNNKKKKKKKHYITNVSGTQTDSHTLLFLLPLRLFFPSRCLHSITYTSISEHTPQMDWSHRHFCLWSSLDQIVPLIINVISAHPPPLPSLPSTCSPLMFVIICAELIRCVFGFWHVTSPCAETSARTRSRPFPGKLSEESQASKTCKHLSLTSANCLEVTSIPFFNSGCSSNWHEFLLL